MTICFVTANSPYGGVFEGIQSYTLALARTLVSLGHRVVVYGFSPKVKKETKLLEQGIIYWILPDRGFSTLRKNFLLLKFVRDFRRIDARYSVDIIHGQGGFSLPLVFIKKVPRVATLHGSQPFWGTPVMEKYFRLAFGRFIYPRLDGLIFVSKAVREAAFRLLPLSRMKTTVIMPIVEDKFKSLAINKEHREIKIAAAGRLETEKNFAELIKAVESLIAKKYKISLNIYGEGRLKKKLNGKFLAGLVSQSELAKVYRECDLFVLPSTREGMPGVLIEAISSGAIPVVSQLPGIDEVIKDQVNGFIIPWPSTSQNIEQTLLRAFSLKKNWFKIHQNAQKTAERIFSSDKNIKEMIKFYHQLV